MKYIIAAIALILAGSYGVYTVTSPSESLLSGVGGDGTIYQLNQWRNDGTYITQNASGTPLKLTNYGSSGDCLVTDAQGVVSTSTCGSGGSSKWTDAGSSIYPSTGESVSASFFSGTSTSATSTFVNASSTTFCLGSDCRTSWPTSGSGGGLSTTSPWTNGNLAYVISDSTVGSVATGTLTETATGLEFNATRGLVGGSAILSLTSGYSIPLTASTTEWAAAYASTTALTPGYIRGLFSNTVTGLTYSNTTGITSLTAGYNIPLSASTTEWSGFYNTPSTRITAGNGLSWSGNTLTATSTHAAVTLSGALDYITLVGQDIVRGAIDLATDITGALGIANGGLGAAFTDPNADRLMFWDDSSGFITGIVTLAGAAISGTTLTINDVTCTDCLTSTEIADEYLFNTGDTGTGVYDFGGADSLEIPNGTGPTVDTLGEIAFDTTDNQLLIATGTSARAVPTITKIWGATIASSSIDFLDGGRLPLPPHRDGVRITEVHCYVDGGTSKVIKIDTLAGGAELDSLTCGTTLTSDTSQSANASLAAGSLMALEFGATTGTVDYVTFSAWGYIIPE